uniref:Spermatogenesis-defective protein 39 homolog n=1 Tax=Strongyloides papillosus TaxID=174720 RepID=A0A0N5BRU8_STREA
MDVRKRFCFDNPEDAYWNENSGETNIANKNLVKQRNELLSNWSFFDDVDELENGDNVASARAALDELLIDDVNDLMHNVNSDMRKCETENTSENDSGSMLERNSCFSDWDDKQGSSNSYNKISEVPDTRKSSIAEFPHKAPSVSSFSVDSTQLDYTRLKSEHRKLQKYLEVVRAERFQPLKSQEIVMRLIKREPVSLDLLRTKEEKMDLIDYGIQYGHQDVIVKILIFLKSTLKSSLFREILLLKSEAAKAFINYLYESEDYEELTTTLYALGKVSEAAMVEFYLASRKRVPEQKIEALKKTVNSGFSDPSLCDSKNIVNNYIDLLERQLVVEMADNVIIKNDKSHIFKEFPRKCILPGTSLYDTIYYCSLYHYTLPENEYSSPLSIKKAFSISEKEYTYCSIAALAKTSSWSDIDNLITSKTLLGGKKITCLFSWKLFFKIVTQHQMPPKTYLEKWLLAVEPVEEREKIANLKTIKDHINFDIISKDDEKSGRERQISGMFAKINKQVEVRKISEAFKSSPIFGRKN